MCDTISDSKPAQPGTSSPQQEQCWSQKSSKSRNGDAVSNFGSEFSHDESFLELDVNSFSPAPRVAAVLPDSPALRYNPFLTTQKSPSTTGQAPVSKPTNTSDAVQTKLDAAAFKRQQTHTHTGVTSMRYHQRDDSAFADDSPPPTCSTSNSDDDNNLVARKDGRGPAATSTSQLMSCPVPGSKDANAEKKQNRDTKDIIADLDTFISQISSRKPRLAEYKDVIAESNARRLAQLEKLRQQNAPPPTPQKSGLAGSILKFLKREEEPQTPQQGGGKGGQVAAVRKKDEAKKKPKRTPKTVAGGVIPLTPMGPKPSTKSEDDDDDEPEVDDGNSPKSAQEKLMAQLQASNPFLAAAAGMGVQQPFAMYPYGMMPYAMYPNMYPGMYPGMPGMPFPFLPPPVESVSPPPSKSTRSKSRSSEPEFSPPTRAKSLPKPSSSQYDTPRPRHDPTSGSSVPSFARSRSIGDVRDSRDVPGFRSSTNSMPSSFNQAQQPPKAGAVPGFRAKGPAQPEVPGFRKGGKKQPQPPPEPEPKPMSILEMFAAHKAKFGHAGEEDGEEEQQPEQGTEEEGKGDAAGAAGERREGRDSRDRERDSRDRERDFHRDHHRGGHPEGGRRKKGDSPRDFEDGPGPKGEIREAAVIGDAFGDMPLRGPGEPRAPRSQRHGPSPSGDPLRSFQNGWKVYRTMRNHFYDMDPRMAPRPAQAPRRVPSPTSRPVFYSIDGKERRGGPSPPRRARSPPVRGPRDHRGRSPPRRDPRHRGSQTARPSGRYHSGTPHSRGAPMHSNDSASSLTELPRRHASSENVKEFQRPEPTPRRVQSFGGAVAAY